MNKSVRVLFALRWLWVCLFFLCISCAHDPHFTTDSEGTPVWRHGALSFDPRGEWGYLGHEGVVWMFGHVSERVWSMVFVHADPGGQSRDELRKQIISAMSGIGDEGTCTDGFIDNQPVLFCRGACRGPLGTVRAQNMIGSRSPYEVVPISYNMFVSDGPDARYAVIVYALEEDIATYQNVLDGFLNSFRFSNR